MKRIFIRIFLLGIIMVFFFSCQQKDKAYSEKEISFYSLEDFPTVDVLNYDRLTAIQDSLVSPSTMEIVGDFMVFLDPSSKQPLKVIDILNEKYIGSYGKKGQGPGELMAPWCISKIDSSSALVYDIVGKKVVGFNVDSLLNGKKPFFEKKINEKGICSDVVLKGKNIYYTSDLEVTNRIFKYDTISKKINGYGFLLNNYGDLTDYNFGQACRGSMSYNADRFVISYLFAPFFEIYNSNTQKWVSILAIERVSPMIDEIQAEGNRIFSTNEDTRLGYLDICLGDDLVYLLYSGKEVEESARDQGNIILVYDYNGKPIRKYELKRSVSAFEVSQDSVLYGITDNAGIELLKFNLK